MVLLGMHYLNSYEGEYNPRIAVKLFRKAADLGDAWGMYHLAECYEKGDGVKKDLDNAFRWFCRAVVTSPEDERLYQSVQDYIFDPNLKQYRENIIGNKHCIR
jgi:TPR repeat protein